MDLPGGRAGSVNKRRCRLCRNFNQQKRRQKDPDKFRIMEREAARKRREKEPEKFGFKGGFYWLRRAVENPKIDGGWPDAGNLEVKIGSDCIGIKQWVRFAWLKRYHCIDIKILWAKTYEDATFGKKKIYNSIEKYIESFKKPEALLFWEKLLKKVTR